MEHEDVMECSVCLCTLHTQCYAEHCPCPDGWEKKKGSTPNAPLGDGAEAEPDVPQPVFPAPVTPPSGQASEATAVYQKFLADMEAITNKHNPLLQYPSSPGQPGTHGLLPLANLGIAPGATGHSGYAVQFGKPREADAAKLTAPKARN